MLVYILYTNMCDILYANPHFPAHSASRPLSPYIDIDNFPYWYTGAFGCSLINTQGRMCLFYVNVI